MSRRLIAAIAATLALAASPSALGASGTTISVTPKSPVVDDDLVVRFSGEKLRRGYEWQIIVTSGRDTGDCASIVSKVSNSRRARVRVRVAARDSDLGSFSEWCQGKGSVTVGQQRSSDGEGFKRLGRARAFRFRAKP